MAKLLTCSKQTLCMDCKDKSCSHAGDKGADCPKYKCDNPTPNDCNHCEYIENYARIMRNKYRKMA